MTRKLLQGFAALGAGLAMLIGLGVGSGIGQATALAAEGVARQPEAVGLIKETLRLGIHYTLVPFIVASLVALILIGIAKIRGLEDNGFSRAMAALGAGIAVLGGIGSALGIGEATAYAVEGVARQPEALAKIRTVLTCGNMYALIPVIGALIIALLLLGIARKGK